MIRSDESRSLYGGSQCSPDRGRKPKSVEFVDDLPKNFQGKILKRILRDRCWQYLYGRVGMHTMDGISVHVYSPGKKDGRLL